jgi:hypothetical protein
MKESVFEYGAVFLFHRARIVRSFKCEVKRISPATQFSTAQPNSGGAL